MKKRKRYTVNYLIKKLNKIYSILTNSTFNTYDRIDLLTPTEMREILYRIYAIMIQHEREIGIKDRIPKDHPDMIKVNKLIELYFKEE